MVPSARARASVACTQHPPLEKQNRYTFLGVCPPYARRANVSASVTYATLDRSNGLNARAVGIVARTVAQHSSSRVNTSVYFLTCASRAFTQPNTRHRGTSGASVPALAQRAGTSKAKRVDAMRRELHR